MAVDAAAAPRCGHGPAVAVEAVELRTWPTAVAVDGPSVVVVVAALGHMAVAGPEAATALCCGLAQDLENGHYQELIAFILFVAPSLSTSLAAWMRGPARVLISRAVSSSSSLPALFRAQAARAATAAAARRSLASQTLELSAYLDSKISGAGDDPPPLVASALASRDAPPTLVPGMSLSFLLLLFSFLLLLFFFPPLLLVGRDCIRCRCGRGRTDVARV